MRPQTTTKTTAAPAGTAWRAPGPCRPGPTCVFAGQTAAARKTTPQKTGQTWWGHHCPTRPCDGRKWGVAPGAGSAA